MTRVLVADDDAKICAAVSRLLAASCDIVGVVRDTDALLEAVARLRPDVVLLDFSLPGRLNALQACRALTAGTSDVRVVAFTGHDDSHIKELAYDAGISGFVWKLKAATQLLPAIQAAVDRSRDGPA